MYITKQYSLMINKFSDDKDRVFTTSELIEEFKHIMNKATIYRLLIRLEADKKIMKSFNESSQKYEYRIVSDCQNHMHLICKECGKIIHLKCSKADTFLNHIFNEHSFIIDEKTNIYGICKECGINV